MPSYSLHKLLYYILIYINIYIKINIFMENTAIVENNFVSIERISEYLDNDTENLE